MSADRPTSQVAAGCCSAPRTRGVGGTGVILKRVDIYLDGVAGGSGRPFSAGLILFLEAGTTFSGYLQQQIGDNQWDNQWDKICILGWKGRRAPDKGSISDTNIVDIYLDGVAGGSGRPFSAGLLLFLEAGTTFSGYLLADLRTRSRSRAGTTSYRPGTTL